MAPAAAGLMALAAGCGSGDGGDSSAALPQFRSVSLLAGALDAGGPGYVDGPATQARFSSPTGVAAADDGAVWISEGKLGRIRRMDAAGRVQTVVADVSAVAIGQDTTGQTLGWTQPGALAPAPGGGVYVAAQQAVSSGLLTVSDRRWVVLRIGRDGSVVPVLRSGRSGVARLALGLAVDRLGRLVVADAACGVWRGTPGAGVAEPELLHHVAGTAETPACPAFDGVTSVTTDPQGRVVYSMLRGDVQRLEGDGRVATVARTAASGYGCVGMAYDRRGRLLFNPGGSQLSVLDAQGQQPWSGHPHETGWFDGPAEAARFVAPCGLSLDANGEAAFVVDSMMHTLRRLEPDGRVTTLAGLARQSAFLDAVGPAARFGESFHLSSGRAGEVLVGDGSLGLVRQIDASGRVRTIAGQPGGDGTSPGLDGPVAQATFVFPRQALVADDGSLWIGDYQAVRRLGPDGIVRQIAAVEGTVRLMALDANRDVLVWASINITGASGGPQIEGLWRFAASAAPGTKPTLLPLRWPADTARLATGLPNGLCVGDDGTVYLSSGHAVLQRAEDGQLSPWAGDVLQPGSADGTAADARFNQPAGLTCAGRGIYVADSGNHTVRYVDQQRRVRTVLGRAGERGVPDGSVPGLLDAPGSLARVPGGIAVSTGLGVVIARH